MTEDASYEEFVNFLLKLDPEATLRSLGYSEKEIETIMKEGIQ